MKPIETIASFDDPALLDHLWHFHEGCNSLVGNVAALSEKGNSVAKRVLEGINALRLKRKVELYKGVLFEDDVPRALAFLEVNGEDSELRLVCGLSYWVHNEYRAASVDQLKRVDHVAADLALQLLAGQVTGLEDVPKSPYVCAVLGDAYFYGIGVECSLPDALKYYLETHKRTPILFARRLAIIYDAIGDTDRAEEWWTYIGSALSSEESTESTS